MKTNYKIVNLRFIAIILVLIYHSSILYTNDWELYSTKINSPILNNLAHFINIFHMPLFFSISGVLFYNKNNISFSTIFIKKIKRLIVPYLLIGILWVIPLRYLCRYVPYLKHNFLYNVVFGILLGKDNGHLWFILALFFIFITSFFIEKFLKNDIYKILVITFLSVAGYFLPSFFGSGCINLFWFYLGYYINKTKLFNIKPNIITYLILIILFCLNGYFITTNLYYSKLCNLLFKYLFCLIIIPILYLIISEKKYKIVQQISNNSFGIYLFHSPLIYITSCYFSNYNAYLIFFINIIIFGSISLILSHIIKESKFKFLIGS